MGQLTRCDFGGVEIDKVERPRTEQVRVRSGPWLLVSDAGEFTVSVVATIGMLSTSCHWRITDSVASTKVPVAGFYHVLSLEYPWQ